MADTSHRVEASGPVPPDHLGDGVYVTDTGHGMVLTTGHHDASLAGNVVYLDHYVMGALVRYLERMAQSRGRSLGDML